MWIAIFVPICVFMYVLLSRRQKQFDKAQSVNFPTFLDTHVMYGKLLVGYTNTSRLAVNMEKED